MRLATYLHLLPVLRKSWSCTFTSTVYLHSMYRKTFTFYILQRVIAMSTDIQCPDNRVHNAKRLHNIFWTKMSTLASILIFNCRKNYQILEISVTALFPFRPVTPKQSASLDSSKQTAINNAILCPISAI